MMETILHIPSKDRGRSRPKSRRPDERNHASENYRIRCVSQSDGTKGARSKSKPAMDGVRNAVNRRVDRTSGRETGSSRSHPPPGRARAEGGEMRRGFVEILAQTVKRPLSE